MTLTLGQKPVNRKWRTSAWGTSVLVSDVYSFEEEEAVLDPHISDHLAHFGIDMLQMLQKRVSYLLCAEESKFLLITLFNDIFLKNIWISAVKQVEADRWPVLILLAAFMKASSKQHHIQHWTSMGLEQFTMLNPGTCTLYIVQMLHCPCCVSSTFSFNTSNVS